MKLQVMMLAALAAPAVACSASHPAAAPASTVIVTAAPKPAATDVDTQYLATLDNTGIKYSSRSQAIATGQTVCAWFKQDHDTPDSAVNTAIDGVMKDLALPQQQAIVLMHIARNVYCPEVEKAENTRDVEFMKQLGTLGVSVSKDRASEIGRWACDVMDVNPDAERAAARVQIKYPEIGSAANASIAVGWAANAYCPKYNPYK